MAFTLTQMRQIARFQALANGSDTSLYTDANIDTAISASMDDFIDFTKFSKRTDSIILQSGTMQLPTLPTGFTAGRLLSAYLTSLNAQSYAGISLGVWTYTMLGGPAYPWFQNANQVELQVVDIAQLINARQGWPANGQPQWIAFNDYNTGFVYPQTPSPYLATAVMSGTFPTMDLASVTINTPGTGIYSAPATTVSDGFGGTATITFTLSAGVITAITPSGSNSLWKQPPINLMGAPVLTANPQVNFALTLRWFEPFTSFTAGCQGTWSATKNYYVGDSVTSGGHIWQANTPNINSPPASPTWTDLGAGTAGDPSTIVAPVSMPDNVVREILTVGTPCFFMFNQANINAQTTRKFEELKTKYMRLGDLGVKSFQRQPAINCYGGGGFGGGFAGVIG